ncbi:MAG: ABC transporter ATP-binding protein [Syntrophomonadaceae bacterium]|jgi:NitT/TauT family transport system ATP-binding protein|nr:ABC transporter ATP-binding protein [Syntrophomonadaceae bacterium]
MGASIELVGVHKDFGQLKVLENWDLVINPAERIAVLGLSGSGKTTFLRLLAGIEAPTQGRLTVVSQKTGFVFQEPRLIPWRTIRQNLLFVNEQANIDELLKTLHLEGFADYLPAQLSGGMKQRVNLARALAVSPDLLLMDEAFASLDLKVKVDIMNDVMQLWQQRRFTMVTVTHDLKEALYLSDRIILISNRPARIIHQFVVNLKEPRQFSSPELLALEGELLRIVCRD